MAKPFDDILVYKIAKEYYIDQLSQSEIVALNGISRPQVSRILKFARENGFVDIAVKLPEHRRSTDLSQALQYKYNLKDIVISPSQPVQSNNNSYASVAAAAAEYLSKSLPAFENIGIGWGNTIYNVARMLPFTRGNHTMNFIPLIASETSDNSAYQTSIIVDRFSEKFTPSTQQFINYPLFMKKSARSEKLIESLNQKWQALDAAVFGIGGIQGQSFLFSYYDEYNVLQSVDISAHRQKAIGDILGHAFLKNGDVIEIYPEHYLTAIVLETLTMVGTRIGIALGKEKIESIDFSLMNHYVNVLITDYDTATYLAKL